MRKSDIIDVPKGSQMESARMGTQNRGFLSQIPETFRLYYQSFKRISSTREK